MLRIHSISSVDPLN